jgi:glycolate oxidase FAD binding subunit
MNLPNWLEAECGSWRDWVLGMTVVQADGLVAKAGSRAVKSVAGYDMHKFTVGSRGTLVIVAEVILRTYPIKSLPAPQIRSWPGTNGPGWFQRVLRSDFQHAVEANAGFGYDLPMSSTLYREDIEPVRFEGDWILRAGQPLSADRFSKRAKSLFDPQGKLNPGEMA